MRCSTRIVQYEERSMMKRIFGFLLSVVMIAGTVLPGFSVSADAVTEV